ncbi:hypothetical protein [Fuscovulum ytuae]|uniref:Class I SAM-dependent methyltransferase n=1 Tax=Fuscovulum ytuae TaxID=3042299 RepID=A0ABY8Q700_9RHOB|nr:hypothetical protein [Fuscovulum sp. YMD61]WGV16065.1 hypothetical protein QF092_17730 [Fuscovulum sp. YMD61]
MRSEIPKRPQLTLPEPAASLVREEYSKARTILEYGSGGSTIEAAQSPGTTVFSVESDASWVGMMKEWFSFSPPKGTVHLHHVDIGPTKEWGYPINDAKWRAFIDYPFSVWTRPDFQHPDVILIDGRFRVGCFLAVANKIQKKTRILFDDYADRPRYHSVEALCKPTLLRGRLAVFDLKPESLAFDDLNSIVKLLHQID